MTALHHLRRRPRPDPRHDLQPLLRGTRLHPNRLLQPRSDPHRPQDRRRPFVVDPGPMPLPRRNQRPRPRRRHHPQPPARRRPRRRLPELPHQQPPRPIRLIGGDLLLQHRRDQRLQHQPGPRQPQPRPPMPRHRDQPVPRLEGGRIVRGAEHLRHLLQQPLGAGPPSLPPYRTASGSHTDPQRPGSGGRQTGPPHGPVGHRPEGRIPGSTPQRSQHQPEIERSLRHPRPHPPRPGTGLPRHPRGHDDLPPAHGRTRGPRSESS
ncbi:hypothetical protein SAURM35S_06268 [Streptomyces aurantiogriseus]